MFRPVFLLLLLPALVPVPVPALARGSICEKEWVKSYKCEQSEAPPVQDTARARWCNSGSYRSRTRAEPAEGEDHVQACMNSYPQDRERICHVYNRRCHGGHEGGGRTDCRGSADCERKAREAHRGGYDKTRSLREKMEQGARSARDNMSRALQSAVQILDRLQQSSISSPADRQTLANDQPLVEQAKSPDFEPEESSQARDTGLLQHVGFAAESRQIADTLEEESKDLKKQEQQFDALGTKAGGYENRLNSVPSDLNLGRDAALPGGGPSAKIAKPVFGRAEDAGDSGAGRKLGAQANGESDISGRSPRLESGAGPQRTPASAGRDPVPSAPVLASARGGPKSSLQELLKNKLDGSDAAKGDSFADRDALEGAEFHRSLGLAEGASLSDRKRAEQELAATVGGAPGFSLGGSESEAEVRRIVSGLDGAAKGAEAGSWLPAGSADLFRRVHDAHASCLKRRCVR